jgi:hypothetical protein
MELEELQKAWKELNERVSQNELVHQQQIIEMLSRQKESCLQRMLRMDKIASIFMLGVTILMFVDFIHLNGKLVSSTSSSRIAILSVINAMFSARLMREPAYLRLFVAYSFMRMA